jgi:hypothetical protein
MRMVVEILAPGLVLEPWTGTATKFEAANFTDPKGHSVRGFRAQLTASVRGGSSDRLRDRAVVVAQALLDLLLRWPLAEPQISVTVNGKPIRRTHDISRLQTYEMGALLSGGPGLPRTQLSVGPQTPPRIELLWLRAMGLPDAELDRLLGPLAQASVAAAAQHPFDRVAPLWSAMELLYPRPRGDLARIDAIVSSDSTLAAVETARGRPVLARLLRFRGRLARDPWLHEPVRRRLQSSPRSRADRVAMATVLAYAIRSEIVHGQWSRFRDDRRLEAGAAEGWLWQLVEREIEMRLAGQRLDVVRAVGAGTISV